MIYGDGSRYTGQWRHNEKHGTGEEMVNGEIKYGEWVKNTMVKKLSYEQLSRSVS